MSDGGANFETSSHSPSQPVLSRGCSLTEDLCASLACATLDDVADNRANIVTDADRRKHDAQDRFRAKSRREDELTEIGVPVFAAGDPKAFHDLCAVMSKLPVYKTKNGTTHYVIDVDVILKRYEEHTGFRASVMAVIVANMLASACAPISAASAVNALLTRIYGAVPQRFEFDFRRRAEEVAAEAGVPVEEVMEAFERLQRHGPN